MTVWAQDLLRDFRYAWRGLARSPIFTITAIGAVALGMGMNTAFFSLVNAVAFRPIPARDPATLRNVWLDTRGDGSRSSYGSQYNVSWVEYKAMRENAKLADLAVAAQVEMTYKESGRALRAELCSDNLLPLLGGHPAMGRFFLPAETSTVGSSPVAVLSYRAWQEKFGGAMDIVSKPITLNRTAFTVVGVADSATSGPMLEVPDLWIPLTMQPLTRPGEAFINDPNGAWLRVLARKHPGISDAQLRAELTTHAQKSLTEHNPKLTAVVTIAAPALMNDPIVFRQGAPVGVALYAAFSLVLIIACTNVANMLLARGEARRKEMAIRLSLGAPVSRLVRQLLAESVLLGLAGGFAGLVLARIAGQVLLAALTSGLNTVIQADISPNAAVFAYTLGLSLVVSVAFGILPALRASRVDPQPALKNEEGAIGRRRFGLRGGLVAVQAAVCFVLLVNAALLLRGIQRVGVADLGRYRDHVLVASFDLRQQQFTAEQSAVFLRGLREAVQHGPIESAGLTDLAPFHSACDRGMTLMTASGKQESVHMGCEQVSEGYFKASGIPIVLGRDFTADEVRGPQQLAIVDQAFAARYFAGKRPIGQIVPEQPAAQGPAPKIPVTIVGVVGNIQHLDPSRPERATMYTPLRGGRQTESLLLARYQGSQEDAAAMIRAAVKAANPDVTVTIEDMAQSVDSALSPMRVAGAAAAGLGTLALILACTGVYAVVAFSVNRRTREIGIRMALGAGPGAVLKLIVGQGLRPVFIGLGAGLLLALGAGQVVRALLYGLSPFDPLSFATMSALLIAISTAAVLGPARRAVQVDPSITLRHD